MNNNEKYEAVIGLEVHAQLLTSSKLFCGDDTKFGSAPNTQVSAISLAHPGTLPVMNEAVIEKAVTLGLALHCQIVQHNYFARKNYFYPDLPKAYQVSQHTAPICKAGYLTVQTSAGEKKILLNRIHMEEDAGKSMHDLTEDYTCIDLNRAGTPLLEIVTEPCIHSGEEAYAYLTELRKLVRWLQVCDGNMEEGSLRCDANISIRLKGDQQLGTRVEVKNLNSIRNVKRAIEFEIDRLIKMSEKGEAIVQQTRSFNADEGSTFALRSKEDAEDYRYFPEPDLPPFNITNEYLNSIKARLPLLPEALQQLLTKEYGLSGYDAMLICSDKTDVDFFREACSGSGNYKTIANWFNGPVRAYINENNLSPGHFPITATQLALLADLTASGAVSFNVATHQLFPALVENGDYVPIDLAKKMNLMQEHNETAIEEWVDSVLAKLPEKVTEYKNGKKGLIGLFAGEVKKISKGKADMQAVNRLLEEKLK